MHNYKYAVCREWNRTDCLYRVDAAEEGETLHTVAFINRLTGVVTYVDPSDEENAKLKQTIQPVLDDLDAVVSVEDQQGTATLRCHTDAGELLLQFEQGRRTGAHYDAAYISFVPTDCGGEQFDLLAAKILDENAPGNSWAEQCVHLNSWDQPWKEDPTYWAYVLDEDFRHAAQID